MSFNVRKLVCLPLGDLSVTPIVYTLGSGSFRGSCAGWALTSALRAPSSAGTEWEPGYSIQAGTWGQEQQRWWSLQNLLLFLHVWFSLCSPVR